MTNPTACNDLADYEWLTGAEAAAIAAELRDSREPLHRTVERLRRTISASRAHLLVELVDLRRRAAAKFAAAKRMFFTRIGLEQATDQWVAEYKAARFAKCGSVADLCCGVGGDLIAIAAQASVVGVDRDPIALHLAAANAHTVLPADAAARTEFHAAAIEQFDVTSVAAWHVDPDRRPTGHRTVSLAHSSPDDTVIESLLAAAPNGAIKLAPAAVVPTNWAQQSELEWISRASECRQLVVWHGKLAQVAGQRRATVVERDNVDESARSIRTIVGIANQPVAIAAAPDRYVFDVDPAVLAARLKGVLAAEHGLSALSAAATYLTGPHAIDDDAALACFEVVDAMPLRVTSLISYFCVRRIGILEIKKSGVNIDPEKLRLQLKLHGDNAATLILAPIAGRPTAIIARRL